MSLRVGTLVLLAGPLHCRAASLPRVRDESFPAGGLWYLVSPLPQRRWRLCIASASDGCGLRHFGGSQDLGPDREPLAQEDGLLSIGLVYIHCRFPGPNVPIGRALKQPWGDSRNIRQKAYEQLSLACWPGPCGRIANRNRGHSRHAYVSRSSLLAQCEIFRLTVPRASTILRRPPCGHRVTAPNLGNRHCVASIRCYIDPV